MGPTNFLVCMQFLQDWAKLCQGSKGILAICIACCSRQIPFQLQQWFRQQFCNHVFCLVRVGCVQFMPAPGEASVGQACSSGPRRSRSRGKNVTPPHPSPSDPPLHHQFVRVGGVVTRLLFEHIESLRNMLAFEIY